MSSIIEDDRRSISRSRSRNASPLSRRYRPAETDDLVTASDPGAIHKGRIAVVTGAASGIGLAGARKFARFGLQVVISDVDGEALKKAHDQIVEIAGADNVLSVVADVSKLSDVETLKTEAYEKFGEVNVLLHCAAISKGKDGTTGTPSSNISAWKDVLDINLGGTINVIQKFTIPMSSQENPGAIIITGSKQGITNPPGNAAYNVSKAAVKALAENLAHELRNRGGRTTAHLFVPGFTWTGMTGANGTGAKPDGAWTAAETVRYMFDRVRHGDFYIVCPDNETSAHMDRLRIKWAAEDVIEGRPALSRWEATWAPIFKEYMADNDALRP